MREELPKACGEHGESASKAQLGEFEITIFEDQNGSRWIYCDAAGAAISGPGIYDKILLTASITAMLLPSNVGRDILGGYLKSGADKGMQGQSYQGHTNKPDALDE